jgi:predicted metal-dependent peptidase
MPGEATHQRMKEMIAEHVLKYNYWGYLFSRVRRKPAHQFPSIMGVAAEMDGTLTLYYQPELVDQTDNVNINKVLEHEGMHLLNKHIPRLIRILADETDKTKMMYKRDLWNFASDACCNSQARLKQDLVIAGKSWSLIFPNDLKYPDGKPFPDGKTTEWYYHELLKFKKKEMDELAETMKRFKEMLKNHQNWAGGGQGGEQQSPDPSALSRKIDSYITGIIKESVKSFSKDRGNLPAHIRELVEQALGPPKVPYYAIIKKLIKGSRLSKFKRSHTKVNRKRGYVFVLDNKGLPQISPFPGRTRDFTFNVGLEIDTSGSMSMQWIAEGLSGVRNILEKDRHCKLTVMQVDTVIEDEYSPKRVSDIKFQAKGRGGTELFPGLKRAKELGVDVCMVFTDGYCERINDIPRKLLPKKIIWVITPDGTADNVNKTGYVVRI